MGIRTLAAVGIILTWSLNTATAVVLHNAQLDATFEATDAGPHLTAIRCEKTGQTHRFADEEPVSVFVVPADAIHDPNVPVQFTTNKDFKLNGQEVNGEKTHANFHLQQELVQVDVSYELDPAAPVLRKSIVCKAKDKAAYVAGVNQWSLKPVDDKLIWTTGKVWGQPAVLLGDKDGYILTLEWPRSEIVSENGTVQMRYRPGFQLAPGESREVGSGSIVCFQRTFEKDDVEAARRAFMAHVAARVHPKALCPIKFTTWGPWLIQGRADRLLEVMDDIAEVGANIVHFDAGWQWPDHPYSDRLPKLRTADDKTWDLGMTQPERMPEGLLPLVKATKDRGMGFSLWFDAAGCVLVREGDEWALRDAKGEPIHSRMWERRWPEAPHMSLATQYQPRLMEFLLKAQSCYDLAGMMFDNDHFGEDHGRDHNCLANGWDAVDMQLRGILDIFDACRQRRPDMYQFLCHAEPWPWAMLHVTHIHSGDPGMSASFKKGIATDYPARALAFERRLAWQNLYTHFVPPWGIKGDIAGWGYQQKSSIPVNLAHTDEIVGSGEGWTQNMFTCFATTRVRDIRFAFRQMPAFDRAILKEWLAWDRKHCQFIFNCRSLFDQGEDPNAGIVGFSHVGQGRGVIYLFNCAFDAGEAKIRLDENAGFAPGETGIPAYLVYPMKARVPGDTLSYGQELRVSIAPKDCVVIEVGLDAPAKPAAYAEYQHTVATIRRSFDPIYKTPANHLIAAMQQGSMRIEIGDLKTDRRLATQIVETLGAATGRRINLDEALAVSPADAACRLIIGTHEGLIHHPEVGKLFKETLYDRYLSLDGELISAPLAVELPTGNKPTFCLIAPRPEQLSRLANNLRDVLSKDAKVVGDEHNDAQWSAQTLTMAIPTGRPVLRFRPIMKVEGGITLPNGLDYLSYEIHGEFEGKDTLLWHEDIPPQFTHDNPAGWWGDRVIGLTDLAGRKVTLRFSAKPKDGRTQLPLMVSGYDRIAILAGLGSNP